MSPQDAPDAENKLIYLLAHKSRDAAKKTGTPSGPIPNGRRWQESQVNGPIITKVDSVFLDPTDYSPMK